jgi:hypothetical protein
MRPIVLNPAGKISQTGRSRYFGLLACAVMVLCLPGCNGPTIAPATPKLLSITGNGVSTPNAQFTFNPPMWNATAKTFTYHIGSTVRFSVPYPTSIELSIQDVARPNGQPLAKFAAPLSRNYEYAARIENPGGNPANWSVDILTPFDVPYSSAYHVGPAPVLYVLSIVDVSGSSRSQALNINYYDTYYSLPIPPTYTTATSPANKARTPGPCPGGAQDQPFTVCFRKTQANGDVESHTVATTACSYSQAVSLLQNSYPGFTDSSGVCH